MFTQIATIGILCLYTCKFIKIQWEKYDLKNVERADRFDEKNLSLHFFNGVGCLCIKKISACIRRTPCCLGLVKLLLNFSSILQVTCLSCQIIHYFLFKFSLVILTSHFWLFSISRSWDTTLNFYRKLYKKFKKVITICPLVS